MKSRYCTFLVQVTIHFSDVHDKDNLVFGDTLPEIKVTVKDTSTGEDQSGE